MSNLKIVADENIPAVHAFFGRFGDIETYPGRNLSTEQVKDADILLVRSVTKVNESLLAGSRIKFVGTCTIGIDHLDTDYLVENDIAFSNAPGCNADGVVQYDLTALSIVDENWQSRKVGIIGCGNVGGRLLKALRALGVDCAVYDPYLSDNGLIEGQSEDQQSLLTDLESVLACDVICMHAPYTTTGKYPSHHMIDEQALKKMRPGAVLLNAGRGGAIDNKALLEHLNNKADLRVILDVWEDEPHIDVALMDKVKIATSHIAGYGFEGKLNGSAMIFSALLDFLADDLSSVLERTEYENHCKTLLGKLKGAPESVECTSVNNALRSTYDILADDARFRQAIAQAHADGGRECVAQAFDLLRKGYPKRRELNHFKASSSDQKLKQNLNNIGFV